MVVEDLIKDVVGGIDDIDGIGGSRRPDKRSRSLKPIIIGYSANYQPIIIRCSTYNRCSTVNRCSTDVVLISQIREFTYDRYSTVDQPAAQRY